MTDNKLPEHLMEFLGEYGVQVVDPESGEPVGWGYPLIKNAGEEKWQELGQLGKLEYVREGRNGTWHLITSKLTREQAIEKYGPVTEEIYGPRGGWKYVVFGTTKFVSKLMKEEK
jgi:hypothetical protein